MADLAGQTFDGFEILSKLGQGGMGAVYKARQVSLNRFVALKVMSNALAEDQEFIERFKREATTAAQFKHPNIVQVYAAGESNGTHYMAMEFVEGRTLREHIRSHGRLDPQEAIAITLHVAEGLKYAWNKSRMIHRDIKPDNVFLSQSGEVLVGDLGLAKSLGGASTEMTSTGMMLGSPHYISPEQAMAVKDIDFRADIYSLGCTLFQMLTGRTAYEGDSSMVLMMKHVHDPPPDIFEALPECPRKLGVMVGRMMAKNRDDRPPSYDELIAGLWEANESAIGEVEIGRPPATPALPPTAVGRVAAVPTVVAVPRKRVSPGMIYGVVGAAAVLLLIGLFLWSPWNRRTDEQGRREDAKPGLESRLQAESVSGQPAKAGTPNPALASAALQLLGSVFTNSVGAEMVYIPPGEFMLGSTKEEQARVLAKGAKEEDVKREGEAPRKAMMKQGFWMGRTEVTVGQWKQFVAATGYVTDGEKKGESFVPQPLAAKKYAMTISKSWRDPNFGFEPRDDHPVCCVSWNDAMAFCEWLTEHERKAGRLAQGYAVRLPTEAEWEYACRAGTQTIFWWGDSKEEGKGRLNWHGKEDGFEFVAPADSYGARGRNPFGLADMLGNVFEWCLDEYDATQVHEGFWMGNPDARLLRGGSFGDGIVQCRCAYHRGNCGLADSNSNHGFRVCVGVAVSGGTVTTASPSPAAASKEAGILTPPETRVAALTTNPKVGEVFTLNVGSNVTMELMGIPPGEFMLGSTQEEQAWAVANGQNEKAIRNEGEVTRTAKIKQGFWMGRTEVTVGQWKQFVKETGYATDGEKNGESSVWRKVDRTWGLKGGASWRDPDFGFEMRDDYPVSCVSWNDAKAFCKWLNNRERIAGRLPQGCEMRLPTEAEWEYACRAGMQTRFWWGDSTEDSKGRLNWDGKEDGFEFVAPADNFGARGRNQFGLADMLGNVWEWCLDEYDENQAHEEWWTGDPRQRVLRGGSFVNFPASDRCASRLRGSPTGSFSNFGFRICVGAVLAGDARGTSTPSPSVLKNAGILAPAETRAPSLTTNPKVGEVFTLNVGSNMTMELMGIPPGEFMLGSTKEEQAWAVTNGLDERYMKREGETQRKAVIKQGFWMGRTEVTVGQWKQFVKETSYVTDGEKNGASFVRPHDGKPWVPKKGASWRNPDFGFELRDDHPVSCISWNDAVAFCEWLTKRERKAGRLTQGYAMRLPTEAEWEYACRAGSQSKFWWGERKEDGKGRLNWSGNQGGFALVAPVDSYGARGRNGLGLADMLGNVYEWCLDEYDPMQAHEDLWTGNADARMLRGGSFWFAPSTCRCAHRRCKEPSASICDYGFRVCYGVDVSGAKTTTTSTSSAAAPKEGGILAPPETRVVALTTNPKVGEVFTLNVGSNVTMELMGIPPGEFMLGSTKEEQEWAVSSGLTKEEAMREGEAPRKATIKQGFWMGRTEVTVGQWKQFASATGYITDGEKSGESSGPQDVGKPWKQVKGMSWKEPKFFALEDNQAVTCISWNDAVAFCKWLTKQQLKADGLASGLVVRLPTEAEWEYACRAGGQAKFWWGESKEDGKDRLNWGEKNLGREFVAPVGSYGVRGQNRFGLTDMLGNVFEWCLDEYDATQAHEDLWTGDPSNRVLRGGSFHFRAIRSRCAYRNRLIPTKSNGDHGFRVAVGPAR